MSRLWLWRLLLVITALGGLGLLGSGALHAAPAQTSPGAGTFTGTVKQNGPTLILHAKDGDHQITVAPGAPVLRDGKPTTVDKLKKGDKVTATLDAQGIATRLDATPGGTSAGDVLKWLIPLIVLILIALALLWWWLSRERRGRGASFGRLHHA